MVNAQYVLCDLFLFQRLNSLIHKILDQVYCYYNKPNNSQCLVWPPAVWIPQWMFYTSFKCSWSFLFQSYFIFVLFCWWLSDYSWWMARSVKSLKLFAVLVNYAKRKVQSVSFNFHSLICISSCIKMWRMLSLSSTMTIRIHRRITFIALGALPAVLTRAQHTHFSRLETCGRLETWCGF